MLRNRRALGGAAVVGAAALAAAYLAVNTYASQNEEEASEEAQFVTTAANSDGEESAALEAEGVLDELDESQSNQFTRMSAEQKAKIAAELQGVTIEIANQMQSIQQEMNAMKAQIHDDQGLGGLRKELDAIKSGGIDELEKHMKGQVDASSTATAKHESGTILLPHDAQQEPWQCGTQVDARWKGGEHFFPATIALINTDGSCNLHYGDGGRERNVAPSFIRKHQPSAEPESLESSMSSLRSKGVRRRQNGDTKTGTENIPGLNGDKFDPVAFEKYMR